MEPPGPIRFSARLDLKPDVDPGEYRGIPVEVTAVEPSEEELAQVLDRIRESHAEFHPVEGRRAAAGDFAVADVAGRFIEILELGQNPRTFRDEKLTLEVGHADSMAEINEALTGALPGETRTFRKTFADDFANDDFRGKTVDYEVTLVALKEKQLPEFDDDFARAVAQANPPTLSARKFARTSARRRNRAAAQVPPRDPRGILSRTTRPRRKAGESEIASSLRDYARYLAPTARPKETDWEKISAGDARPAPTRRVREYLVLDAVARREGIRSPHRVDAEVKRAALAGVEASDLREAAREERRPGKRCATNAVSARSTC